MGRVRGYSRTPPPPPPLLRLLLGGLEREQAVIEDAEWAAVFAAVVRLRRARVQSGDLQGVRTDGWG